MDGISRSRGWDKEIPHGVLPMEQLVLSDKWARKKSPRPTSHWARLRHFIRCCVLVQAGMTGNCPDMTVKIVYCYVKN